MPLVATGASSIIICQYFREKFRLLRYGVGATYSAAMIVPAISTFLLNTSILDAILSVPVCDSCIKMRAGVYQTFSSTIYPIIVTPFACIFFARKYQTYVAPGVNFQPNVIYALKSTPMVTGALTLIVLANFGIGYMTAQKQADELDTITEKEAIRAAQHVLDKLENMKND